MPRTNINYSNTIIYKLCCNDLNITEVYVGQTTDFRKRKNNHKVSCNNQTAKGYNYNVYQFIRDNGGWDNWNMIEIEKYNAIDGNDAKKRERFWIEELKAILNCKIPTRLQKEYYENNKQKIKIYRNNHKEDRKKHDKKYYENNKEIINEKKKEYHQQNIEYFKEYYSEKIKCDCGCEIRKSDLTRHKRTKKHINLMSQLSISSMNTLTSEDDVVTTEI